MKIKLYVCVCVLVCISPWTDPVKFNFLKKIVFFPVSVCMFLHMSVSRCVCVSMCVERQINGKSVYFSLINWHFFLLLDTYLYNTRQVNNLKVAWHFLLRFSNLLWFFHFSASFLSPCNGANLVEHTTTSPQTPCKTKEKLLPCPGYCK